MVHSKNTIAVAPGATIRDQLEYRGMSQKEFAARMDMSEKHISHLINGKVELTSDVSLRLEYVLGIPSSYWMNLEAAYREQLARVEAENDMDADEEIAKKIPYAKMAAFAWVPATRQVKEKVRYLRNFFEVAKLGLLENLCIPGVAYRANGTNATSDYALAAWSQKARLEARKMNVSAINIALLQTKIPEIRALTLLTPESFCERLRTILSECGVAIVFLPHIGGSFLHGASFVDGNHIVLGLTVRGKDADRFWFSLFHELYHILAGHINSALHTTQEEESDADTFARDTLISPDDYGRLIMESYADKETIVRFAQEIGVAPGIVLGRLQKEGLVSFDRYHDLKEQYQIA
jgi:HTH-type transcriptional regulator/antitoxin HigA